MARRTVDPQQAYRHLKDKVNWALCDKCGFHWPETILEVHAGIKICPNHSEYKETTEEKDVRTAKAEARIARRKEPQPKWPHPPEMRSVSGVYKLTPWPLSLARGGANKTWTLTGRNLSDDDAFTFSTAAVELAALTAFTAIDPETRGNTATLTVHALVGAKNGKHDLVVNGDVFKDAIEVIG